MTEKLRPCPFCGGKARIQLTDDEGNFQNESYLEDPYSGVGYVIIHDTSNSTDCCPIATYSDSSQGIYIYESKEAAINAWNGRTEDDLMTNEQEINILEQALDKACEYTHNNGVNGCPSNYDC